MRFLIVLLALPLLGLSPVSNSFKEEQQIKDEFDNIYQNVQGKQFRVVTSTPALTELQDHEVVIFSSGAVKLMLRDNQDIYSVNVSCITLRR